MNFQLKKTFNKKVSLLALYIIENKISVQPESKIIFTKNNKKRLHVFTNKQYTTH